MLSIFRHKSEYTNSVLKKQRLYVYNRSMQKPWFKLTKWGKGWMPIRWQGWVLFLLFFALNIYNYIRIFSTQSTTDATVTFVWQTILFIGLFSIICYFKSEKTTGDNLLQ